MIFRNKINGQVAHIEDAILLEEFKANEQWVESNDIKEESQSVDYNKLARVNAIKYRLNKISEDLIQSLVGEVIPNIEERKKEFILLHNELRLLEGKTERNLK